MSHFHKPAHSVDEQLATLCDRGLLIGDEARATHYLGNISYFRLSAYTRPFYQPGVQAHCFLEGTRFEDVLQLDPRRRLYLQLVVIESLMRVVSPGSQWAERLVTLLDQYPQVSRPHMGFPQHWDSAAFWQAAVMAARKEVEG